MKSILILGGADKMLPVIRYASEAGYYTIVCDYMKENVGRHYANEFHQISTTDQDAVLELAKKKAVDGIISYSSDVISLTAAYVGNELNLPSNPYQSVLTLIRKDLFRTFLKKNRFPCPKVDIFDSIEDARNVVYEHRLPFMVKPVDLAGSRGVLKIERWEEFEGAFLNAQALSKVNKVLVEEYIHMNHEYMIAGDAFVSSGKVVFFGLMNSHRASKLHPFVPTGTSYPVILDKSRIDEVERTIQRVVDLLEIRFGGLNLELMYDEKGDLYIIEIAPRNGGNMIPELLEMATGFNMIGALVEASVGRTDIEVEINKDESFYSTYVLHSNKSGRLKDIEFSDEIACHIIQKVIFIEKGQEVFAFDDATKSIGILFLQFFSLKQQMDTLKKMDSCIEIVLDDSV